jgi:hypothetical protein
MTSSVGRLRGSQAHGSGGLGHLLPRNRPHLDYSAFVLPGDAVAHQDVEAASRRAERLEHLR